MVLLIATNAQSQDLSVHSISPDTSLWNFYGDATTGQFQGRSRIRLNSAIAEARNVDMRNGILDVEAFTEAKRAFFGFDFRIDGGDFEEVYLRKHKSGLPDAMQYTPVLRTGRNWQLFNGPGFTGGIDIPSGVWFRLRLEVTGAQAKLFVGDTLHPALVMDDLKSGIKQAGVALYSLGGGRGGAAGTGGHPEVSRRASSERIVPSRFLNASGAAAGNEGCVCADYY